MSKKHYIQIAKELSRIPDSDSKTEIIKVLCRVFKEQNQNFRPLVFACACSYKSES